MEIQLNGFDEFWTTYPRRVGKLAALKAYKRALKMTTPDRIFSSARKYAADRAGQDAQFTKHPATWLNAGCWEDYAANLTKLPDMAAAQREQPLCYVKFQDRDAWDDWGRAHGKRYPRDKAGGWWFPARIPPGQGDAA
jgi:hypothetical protein